MDHVDVGMRRMATAMLWQWERCLCAAGWLASRAGITFPALLCSGGEINVRWRQATKEARRQ